MNSPNHGHGHESWAGDMFSSTDFVYQSNSTSEIYQPSSGLCETNRFRDLIKKHSVGEPPCIEAAYFYDWPLKRGIDSVGRLKPGYNISTNE